MAADPTAGRFACLPQSVGGSLAQRIPKRELRLNRGCLAAPQGVETGLQSPSVTRLTHKCRVSRVTDFQDDRRSLFWPSTYLPEYR